MDKSEFRYQSLFCEENIWHAVKSLESKLGLDKLDVLLFINSNRSILLMNQIPFGDSGIGCWDYHVVLWDRYRQVILDFDSRCSWEVSGSDYFAATFPQQELVESHYRTTVRKISGENYLRSFSSDRSHMLDAEGLPFAEFPTWPTILGASQSLKLSNLIDVAYRDSRISDYPVGQFAETEILRNENGKE